MLMRLQQLAAKLETTEGTAISLANTDANFLARNIGFEEDIEQFERDLLSPSFDRFASVGGAQMGQLSFEIDLYGGVNGTTAPHWDLFLKACGLKVTGSGPFVYTVSSVWDPNTMGSSDHKSLTIEALIDGQVRTIRGARGNAVFVLGPKGRPGYIRFTFIGVLVDTADKAFYTSVSYPANSKTPPQFRGATVSLTGAGAGTTLAASEAKLAELSIDLGNQLSLVEDQGVAEGYRSCAIVDRFPKMNFDPQALTVAQGFDFFGQWKSDALMALAVAWGTATPNKFTIAAPAVKFRKLGWGDRNSIVTRVCEGELVRSADAGDDCFVFTANVA